MTKKATLCNFLKINITASGSCWWCTVLCRGEWCLCCLLPRKWDRNSWICPFIGKTLFWAEIHPTSKLHGNLFCSFCLILLTTRPNDKHRWEHLTSTIQRESCYIRPTSVFEVSKAQYNKCFHSVAPSFYTVSVERVNIKTGMELWFKEKITEQINTLMNK